MHVSNSQLIKSAEKSCKMLTNFLKMFIDTSIPFDKSLVYIHVKLLEPNPNVMLVEV